MPEVKYRFAGGNRVWLHRQHEVVQDRFGLFEGRCTWMTTPEYYRSAIPGPFSGHPQFPWLQMERYSMRTSGAFVAIECEYAGIDGEDSEPVYELSNSAGEFPIEGHPNISNIILNAGLTRDQYSEDGKFTEFPVAASHDYPTGKNLAGVEAYLDYGEVVWRKTWNARSKPSGSDLERVGKIDSSPDGSPPSPTGRDWILISNSFLQRGKTYRRTKEWKLSGPDGANTDIYGDY